MINLKVDEAYAFDYLSILEIKKDISQESNNIWLFCIENLKNELGYIFNDIIASSEYQNMIIANRETFKMVDLAKENKCSARDVDICNYNRYKAKTALQKKYFNTDVTETKVGYEKYEE